MRLVYRLICALLLLLCMQHASAVEPTWTWRPYGGGNAYSNSGSCVSDIIAAHKRSYPDTGACYTYTNVSGLISGVPWAGFEVGGCGSGGTACIAENPVCPAGYKLEGLQCIEDGPKQCAQGSELVDGQCVCKPGFVQGDGGCFPEKDKPCAGLEDFCGDRKKQGWNAIFKAPGAGAEFVCHSAENANSGGWSEPAFPGCSKGCMVSTGTTVSVKDDAGKWYTTGTGSYVGSTCDPNVINKLNEGKEDEKEVTPPDSKDPGKCNGQAGTVNGKDVCLPWSGAEGDNKSETKQKPDGSTTKTDTKTTCTGNSCTTTTTTTGKDSSGNTTGTTTTSTTTTKDDYCSRNSGSSVCGALDPTKKPGTGTGGGSGSGSGSGSCEGADCEDNDGPTLPGKPAFGKFGAPEQPKLYTTKYPDGIAGVWSAKTAEIKSAPISNLVGDLMPKVADGGTPPTWIIDLDMGGIGNFGQRDISPPSWLWGVLKAITILSALLLARRLVFGG